MPTPMDDETQQEWMKRCVPMMMDEGRDQDQSVAACMSMWKEHAGEKESEPPKASPVQREHKEFPVFEKQIEDRLVKGLYAVMGHVDDGNDRILPRAFRKSLKDRGYRVRVLWQHDASAPPVGVPLLMKEIGRDELPEKVRAEYLDATGALYAEVKYLDTPRGNEILTGIREDAIKENSIGYDPMTFDFEDMEGTRVRNLKELRLWDISPVNWGMQPATVNLKTQSQSILNELSGVLQSGQTKEGRVLSSRNLERLRNALDVLNEILLAAEPPESEMEMMALTEKVMTQLSLYEHDPILLSVR